MHQKVPQHNQCHPIVVHLCGQRVKMGHYKWIVSTPFETSKFLHQGQFEKVWIFVSILAAWPIVSENISLESFNS